MKNNFREGFKFKGLTYGWKRGHLYRLPFVSEDGRHFSTQKLKKITVGNRDGFVVGQVKKSINQLKDMTVKLNQKDLNLK